MSSWYNSGIYIVRQADDCLLVGSASTPKYAAKLGTVLRHYPLLHDDAREVLYRLRSAAHPYQQVIGRQQRFRSGYFISLCDIIKSLIDQLRARREEEASSLLTAKEKAERERELWRKATKHRIVRPIANTAGNIGPMRVRKGVVHG